MKNKVLLICLCVLLSACGVQNSASFYGMKSQLLRTEYDGTYIIRAAGMGDNSASAMQEARKTAVYDVIFKGVASANSKIPSLKPLLLEVNAENKYQDYFNAFFADGGIYEDFISIRDKRAGSSSYHRNKSGIQCHTDVSVDVAALKNKLKEDNILK